MIPGHLFAFLSASLAALHSEGCLTDPAVKTEVSLGYKWVSSALMPSLKATVRHMDIISAQPGCTNSNSLMKDALTFKVHSSEVEDAVLSAFY